MLILKFMRRCVQSCNRWILNLQLSLSQLLIEKQSMIGITHLTNLNSQKRTFILKVKSNLKSNKSINDVSQKLNLSQSSTDWWMRRRNMISDESKDKENRLSKMNWDLMQDLESLREVRKWLLTWTMSLFSSSIELLKNWRNDLRKSKRLKSKRTRR